MQATWRFCNGDRKVICKNAKKALKSEFLGFSTFKFQLFFVNLHAIILCQKRISGIFDPFMAKKQLKLKYNG